MPIARPVRAARHALMFAAWMAVTSASATTFVAVTPVAAQTAPATAAPEYTFRQAMISTRDGVKLYTAIFAPKDLREPLPFMFIRTPYGAPGEQYQVARGYPELAAERYIFVFQDIRGRYKSEGQFVMQRPPRIVDGPGPRIDESTDAWDTVDWLLKNVPNHNGKVGMLGVSYPGWLTAMAMLDPHPALTAVSPQASPADMWIGDDFHHNGAFRLSYGFEYAVRMESDKEQKPFAFDRYDTYDWYLSLGPLSNVNARHLRGAIPTWNDYVAHPDYDEFWQRQTLIPHIQDVKVPTLNVAGWWDQEDFYGPMRIYEALEQHDTNHLNYLVVGPWNHGGWRGASGQKLGNIDFGSPTSREFRANIEAPFFAHFLKDRNPWRLAEATVFESGANAWRSYDSWPLKTGVTARKLFFGANGALSFDAPTAAGAFDEFLSDPAKPVPYRTRPIATALGGRGSTWSTWLADDQRFAQDRIDVVAWETPVLTEDVTISGALSAHLFASTTGSDADWVAKLIDVYPEGNATDPKMGGFQFMVANDVFRGRFRESFEKPKALVPNAVNEFVIDLHTQAYRFLKGHRIRVQVQSTWFPLIDRNPQTYVPNIFEAKASDFKRQTHRIWRAPGKASYVELPILNPSAGGRP